MIKEFYDKYGKEFHCAECTFLDNCLKSNEPLYGKCCEKFLRDKISDLEAKLEQSQKERELDNNFWKQECDSLQKALDESENKIDKLEDKLHHYYEETLNNGTCGLCEHLRSEYKTDFAIERLEKLKELVRDNSKATGFVFAEQTIDVEDFEDLINQQIKELKEKK